MVNPILHEGGHIVPTHVDDLLCCFCECSKWAHFSWLYFLQHLLSPIEAIFEKKVYEQFEKLKKWNLNVPTPLEKNMKKIKNGFFDNGITLFQQESDFYIFLAFFWGT